MKKWNAALITTLILPLALTGPWAQSAVILTPPDLNDYLEKAVDRVQDEAFREQKRTGGALLAGGAGLVAAAMGSTVIGNDYTIGAAPGIFLASGSLFSLGGLVLLFRGAPFDRQVQNFKTHPQWKLEDVSDRVTLGQDIINQQSIIAERERWWGGSLTILAGATNIVLGTFAQAGTGTPRESMQSTGYFFGSLGLLDMIYEGRLWSGGSMAALGEANLTVYHTDLYSPSSDYLFISGGMVAASGILRVIKKRFAEDEEVHFRDFIKGANVTLINPEFFVTPADRGMIAGVRGSF